MDAEKQDLAKRLGFGTRILSDDNAESPREWNNTWTMACWSRRHQLGDIQPKEQPVDWYLEFKTDYPDAVIVPLYKFEHGGVVIASTPFSCPFDSGQVGYAYVKGPDVAKFESDCEEARRKTLGFEPKSLAETLEAELEIYNAYLGGEVYAYAIQGPAGDVDSCGGYYTQASVYEAAAEALDAAVADFLARATPLMLFAAQSGGGVTRNGYYQRRRTKLRRLEARRG